MEASMAQGMDPKAPQIQGQVQRYADLVERLETTVTRSVSSLAPLIPNIPEDPQARDPDGIKPVQSPLANELEGLNNKLDLQIMTLSDLLDKVQV